MSKEIKKLILQALGLDVDVHGFVVKDGFVVFDKYIDKMVTVENMAVFPGDPPIILDDNPLSIASYMEEYGEI